MIRRFINWLRGLFGRAATYRIQVLADVPDRVDDRTLYVIGERQNYWLAIMRCPCGCGAEIQLPLSGSDGPRWTVSGTPKAPTLTPSVHRTKGCRSHFFMRGGTIIWCR
ncbi:DUF6527 family protein [Paludibacterium sp.]|uniref:DUF6527 family protein n=1 Tax=Paludibacterium sp. TaxID=1917523 RepID=UPI0025E549EF|nr:DUF6527 family protein [Paludibacterium sp.]MBV8646333.1 hypothetical protein [Paludibacterium sp.]